DGNPSAGAWRQSGRPAAAAPSATPPKKGEEQRRDLPIPSRPFCRVEFAKHGTLPADPLIRPRRRCPLLQLGSETTSLYKLSGSYRARPKQLGREPFAVPRFIGRIERPHPAVPEQEIEPEVVARLVVVGVGRDRSVDPAPQRVLRPPARIELVTQVPVYVDRRRKR